MSASFILTASFAPLAFAGQGASTGEDRGDETFANLVDSVMAVPAASGRLAATPPIAPAEEVTDPLGTDPIITTDLSQSQTSSGSLGTVDALPAVPVPNLAVIDTTDTTGAPSPRPTEPLVELAGDPEQADAGALAADDGTDPATPAPHTARIQVPVPTETSVPPTTALEPQNAVRPDAPAQADETPSARAESLTPPPATSDDARTPATTAPPPAPVAMVPDAKVPVATPPVATPPAPGPKTQSRPQEDIAQSAQAVVASNADHAHTDPGPKGAGPVDLPTKAAAALGVLAPLRAAGANGSIRAVTLPSAGDAKPGRINADGVATEDLVPASGGATQVPVRTAASDAAGAGNASAAGGNAMIPAPVSPSPPTDPSAAGTGRSSGQAGVDAQSVGSSASLLAPIVERIAIEPVPVDPAAAEAGETAASGTIAPTATEARVAAPHQAGLSSLARATIETTAQLASQITRRLEGRYSRFELALTPEGLGRVDVTLDIGEDGRLAARLAFDNPLAATDLRGRADELRRQLEEAGFTLDRDALEFSEREPSSGGGQAFDRRQDRAAAYAHRSAAAEAEVAAMAPPHWSPLSQTPQGVDVKV